MPCEDEEARAKGRREDAGRLESTSQGTPVVAREPQTARGWGRGTGPFALQPSEGASPADTLISGFWPPKL